jgi:hypothetical protein
MPIGYIKQCYNTSKDVENMLNDNKNYNVLKDLTESIYDNDFEKFKKLYTEYINDDSVINYFLYDLSYGWKGVKYYLLCMVMKNQ